MKLIDKVVFCVLGTVLIIYIVYIHNKGPTLNGQRSQRAPLLKDSVAWNTRQDALYKEAVRAFQRDDPSKRKAEQNISRKDSVQKKSDNSSVLRVSDKESLHSDQILRDGLRISYSKSSLQVNIIEENEKALVYWLIMAKTGMLKMNGNTLIVFSYDLEMNIPKYFPHFPFNRVPIDDNELIYVLQSPGSYIMKCVLLGLVKRIIWVLPNWSKESIPNGQQRIEFGIVKMNNVISFCKCESDVCIAPWWSMIPLSSDKCQSKISVAVDRVKEGMFSQKLSEKNWITSANDILLHIDATYFGYVPPSSVIQKVITDNKILIKINNLTKKLFCPHSIQEETYMDRLLLKAIEYSKINKECLRNKMYNIVKGPFAYCKGVTEPDFQMEDEIYKFLRRKLENSSYLCKQYTQVDDFLLKEIALTLKQRSIVHLESLKRTGFCLSTTVKTPQTFGLCSGPTDYDKISSYRLKQERKPTTEDIKARIGLLQLFITTIPVKNIKTVTFCRSVRRGNGPRYYMSYIESNLLKGFRIAFPNFNLNYDRHILGHKEGWYHRSYLNDTI